MYTYNNTVNKRDVKEYSSFVLLATLKFAQITAQTPVNILIDILIAAAVRGSSIEETCRQYKNAPSGKTVRTHIALQLESLEDVEVRLNRALRKHIPKKFRRKPVKVAIDYVEVAYHGNTQDPDEVRKSQPKEGTSHFHTYATAYVIEKGRRYTIAITYVKASDTTLDVLRRLNKRINQLAIRVELYLIDRAYYCVEVIKWFIRYNKAFIMPVVARGKKASEDQQATGTRALKASKVSRWDRYTISSPKHGQVTFDVAICCTNYNGKQKKKGRCTYVYATYGVRDHSLTWIRETYRSRFGIETSHRQMRQLRIKTSTTNSTVRYLYIGIGFVIRNIWVWLHWNVFSITRRGPRGRSLRLSLFSLDRFKSWIRSVMAEIYILIEQISILQPLPSDLLRFR